MIRFNTARLRGPELEYVSQAINEGHISGNGAYTKRAESLLESLLGNGSRVLLTTSCTHALEMSAMLARVGPGDEVIVPAYTFVSTANAFANSGATLRFADVDPLTLNVTLGEIERLTNERTKAICVVHYAGVASELVAIREFSTQHGLTLIEDNAHGLGGSHDGRPLGTFGQLATLSFHETKNITCGEGGALIVNDESLFARAEILREKGTNRSQFFRGMVDKYTWVDAGSSWVISEILAAFLTAQLESFGEIQRDRLSVWNRYREGLEEWAGQNAVRLPHVPLESQHPAHMFYLQFPSLLDRSRYIAHMQARDISTVFHYQALNASPRGLQLGGVVGECPIAEKASDTIVRLPLHLNLRPEDVSRVVEATQEFRSQSPSA